MIFSELIGLMESVVFKIYSERLLEHTEAVKHAPLGQTRHTWGRRKNSQRVKAVRKTVRNRPSANKTSSKVTYSRRRYPENIYRPPRQENKCSFWEPASYDNLSAHFNGVQSVTVMTLDVDPSFVYVLAFLRTRPFACTNLYT
ncbi:hypothetical protein ALC53_09557 [Atta colombica]|uniref:Uncharacterized protein n=1 Tax=Atta colombica TaxID=520822 RepID=A0A195B698_9HYME|nr:hypothetical protein ALC53_09557 [Atta colombica]